MKKLSFLLILLLSISSCLSAKGLPTKSILDETSKSHIVDHKVWNDLLIKYVADNGNVNYKGFKADKVNLKSYIDYLASQIPQESWSKNELLAYYINVYNANTVLLIIENYPLKSIKDLNNPWGKNFIKIGDKDYSLNDIEHSILRKMDEPRIHFAVNCASYSCPKLLNVAFTAKNVQELLQNATIEFINNPNYNKISAAKVELSELFNWYKKDFTEHGSLIDYINTYSKIKVNTDAKISHINYNWSLNE